MYVLALYNCVRTINILILYINTYSCAYKYLHIAIEINYMRYSIRISYNFSAFLLSVVKMIWELFK